MKFVSYGGGGGGGGGFGGDRMGNLGSGMVWYGVLSYLCRFIYPYPIPSHPCLMMAPCPSCVFFGKGLRTIQWDVSKLPVFEKNFYYEHPSVAARPESEAADWRRRHHITVEGQGVPKVGRPEKEGAIPGEFLGLQFYDITLVSCQPVYTFEEASMPEYVLSEVLKQGFSTPTPIQSQGWPMALMGRDMVGISATGSGKTLAFLLPAMIHINAQVDGLPCMQP